MSAWANRRVLLIVLFYAAAIVTFDITTDRLVETITAELHLDVDVYLIQELAIFALTTAILLVVLRREFTHRERAEASLEQARSELELRVRERTRELSTLLEISGNVASTLELQSLLGLILDQVKLVLDYTGACIAVENGDCLTILDYRGPLPADQVRGATANICESQAYRRIVQTREPMLISDLMGDEPEAVLYRQETSAGIKALNAGSRSWLGVPLIARERMIGLLRLDHREPGYFTPYHAQLLSGIANQAASAIENARLYASAQKVAALEERQYLARELHDSISQTLYGVVLGAKTASQLLQSDPSRAREPLDYIASMAEIGLAEMRALIFELRPETLEQYGLLAALHRQEDSLRARRGIAVDLSNCTEPEVSLDVKEALLRIIQEALHNVAKHAHATQARVTIVQDAAGLCVEVNDDGVGFDPTLDYPGHLGLRSMRERALHLGGQLSIESRPGEGAHLRLWIPASQLVLA